MVKRGRYVLGAKQVYKHWQTLNKLFFFFLLKCGYNIYESMVDEYCSMALFFYFSGGTQESQKLSVIAQN